jgi:hypothetical protein
MLRFGRRKDIQDNNNYIGKFGDITHVCPKCGSVYCSPIRLNVECDILGCYRNGYTVTTPEINKVCDCGSNAIQVDNRMGNIIEPLIKKGYKVLNCCEGHAYNKDCITTYDFPFIEVHGDIRLSIPSKYHNMFDISYDLWNRATTISCKKFECCEGMCLNMFNECKTDILNKMRDMTNSICSQPVEDETLLSKCGCECDDCDCQ